MKTIYTSICLFFFVVLLATNSMAQNQSVWARNINALPDTSATITGVRIAYDGFQSEYVLSNYNSSLGAKIYLDKYTSAGARVRRTVLDNAGNNNISASDMAVDDSGNCYLTGSINTGNYNIPMLLKTDSVGNTLWLRDSTLAFNREAFSKIILKLNKLYIKGVSGVAQFDKNGNEQWSHTLTSPLAMAVDNKGQMLVSVLNPAPKNIFRYSAAGVLNFSDSSVYGHRIAVDQDNSFYLFEEQPAYTFQLAKYDSSASLKWVKTDLPKPPAFTLNNYDVLTDYDNNVVLVNLNDTLVKVSPEGNTIWAMPMNRLGQLQIASVITQGNFIAVAATINGFAGFDMKIVFYDQRGNEAWTGYYNGSLKQQESVLGIDVNYTGIYGFENIQQDSLKLVKFESASSDNIDYTQVCVDSVWYNPQDPHYLNVRVFNGSTSFINYPSAMAVSPAGDTVFNPKNNVMFFGQPANSYATYTDTITVTGISDFSNYAFLFSEGFRDTTVIINWCNLLSGIPEPTMKQLIIYPNPNRGIFNFASDDIPAQLTITNIIGQRVYQVKISDSKTTIDISHQPKGIYFYHLQNDNYSVQTGKIIIE